MCLLSMCLSSYSNCVWFVHDCVICELMCNKTRIRNALCIEIKTITRFIMQSLWEKNQSKRDSDIIKSQVWVFKSVKLEMRNTIQFEPISFHRFKLIHVLVSSLDKLSQQAKQLLLQPPTIFLKCAFSRSLLFVSTIFWK